MKFQDLASIVGGFIKIVTLFFSYLNYNLNKYEKEKFLIDYFFNVSDENINNLISPLSNNSNKKFEKKFSCDDNIKTNRAITKISLNKLTQEEKLYNNYTTKSINKKNHHIDKEKIEDSININNHIEDKKIS